MTLEIDKAAPKGAGKSGEEIEITPEMMAAGEEAFYREMIDRDYLDHAPTREGLESVLSAVFYSMYAIIPLSIANKTKLL